MKSFSMKLVCGIGILALLTTGSFPTAAEEQKELFREGGATEDITADVFPTKRGSLLLQVKNHGDYTASVSFTAELLDEAGNTEETVERTLQYVANGHTSYLLLDKNDLKEGDFKDRDFRISFEATYQDYVAQKVDELIAEVSLEKEGIMDLSVVNDSKQNLELAALGVIFMSEEEVLDYSWTQFTRFQAGETKNWRLFYVEEEDFDSYLVVPLYAVYFPAAHSGSGTESEIIEEPEQSGQKNWYADIFKNLHRRTGE